jgi:ribulose-phosphate 3-epimerase
MTDHKAVLTGYIHNIRAGGIAGSGVKITPSLICADMDDIVQQSKQFADLGMEFIHVDMIDGQFSPSEPLTFDVLDKICALTDFPMDFHIMALDNERFIIKALEYNACQICFHSETSLHMDRLLNIIKSHNVRCGIALTPTTPLSVLEYAIELCDFVLLMLINPGYASAAGEKQVAYAERKVRDCRRFLDEHNRDIPIEVDGRVSFDSIPDLVAAGADILVAGTSSLFQRDGSILDNYQLTCQAVRDGLKRRELNRKEVLNNGFAGK